MWLSIMLINNVEKLFYYKLKSLRNNDIIDRAKFI